MKKNNKARYKNNCSSKYSSFKCSPSGSRIITLDPVGAELLVLEDEPLKDADAGRHAVVLDESVTLIFTGNLKKLTIF